MTIEHKLDDEFSKQKDDSKTIRDSIRKTIDDFVNPNTLEDKIDELDKKINTPIGEGTEDREEPMTFDRKLHMMSMLFPIELGSKVRNNLGEDGIVEMVGIDYQGVRYLVQYRGQNSRWETEAEIKKIVSYGDSPLAKNDNKIKTDIPDPVKG